MKIIDQINAAVDAFVDSEWTEESAADRPPPLWSVRFVKNTFDCAEKSLCIDDHVRSVMVNAGFRYVFDRWLLQNDLKLEVVDDASRGDRDAYDALYAAAYNRFFNAAEVGPDWNYQNINDTDDN